jgi:hypothetical protein
VGVEVSSAMSLLDSEERETALRRLNGGELPRPATDIKFTFDEWVHATATATYKGSRRACSSTPAASWLPI